MLKSKLTGFISYQIVSYLLKKKGDNMNSRRTFLRMATAGIVAFFVFLWNKLTLQHLEIIAQKQKIYPFNKNRSVSFNEDVIVVNQGDKTTAYSAHCTHLGCRIDKMEGDRFVCPCHGSQYDLNGKVQKGPAFRNLEVLPSSISEDGNTIIIKS